MSLVAGTDEQAFVAPPADQASQLAADGEDLDLDRASGRLEQLQKKRRNLNRMATEELISWEEFKELHVQ